MPFRTSFTDLFGRTFTEANDNFESLLASHSTVTYANNTYTMTTAVDEAVTPGQIVVPNFNQTGYPDAVGTLVGFNRNIELDGRLGAQGHGIGVNDREHIVLVNCNIHILNSKTTHQGQWPLIAQAEDRDGTNVNVTFFPLRQNADGEYRAYDPNNADATGYDLAKLTNTVTLINCKVINENPRQSTGNRNSLIKPNWMEDCVFTTVSGTKNSTLVFAFADYALTRNCIFDQTSTFATAAKAAEEEGLSGEGIVAMFLGGQDMIFEGNQLVQAPVVISPRTLPTDTRGEVIVIPDYIMHGARTPVSGSVQGIVMRIEGDDAETPFGQGSAHLLLPNCLQDDIGDDGRIFWFNSTQDFGSNTGQASSRVVTAHRYNSQVVTDLIDTPREDFLFRFYTDIGFETVVTEDVNIGSIEFNVFSGTQTPVQRRFDLTSSSNGLPTIPTNGFFFSGVDTTRAGEELENLDIPVQRLFGSSAGTPASRFITNTIVNNYTTVGEFISVFGITNERRDFSAVGLTSLPVLDLNDRFMHNPNGTQRYTSIAAIPDTFADNANITLSDVYAAYKFGIHQGTIELDEYPLENVVGSLFDSSTGNTNTWTIHSAGAPSGATAIASGMAWQNGNLFLRAGTLSGDDLIDSFKVKHVADCSLFDLDTFSSIEAERFDNFKVVHDELTVRSGVNTTSFPTATWHYNINKVLGNVGADVEDTPPGSIQIGGTGSFLISTTDNFGRDRTAELEALGTGDTISFNQGGEVITLEITFGFGLHPNDHAYTFFFTSDDFTSDSVFIANGATVTASYVGTGQVANYSSTVTLPEGYYRQGGLLDAATGTTFESGMFQLNSSVTPYSFIDGAFTNSAATLSGPTTGQAVVDLAPGQTSTTITGAAEATFDNILFRSAPGVMTITVGPHVDITRGIRLAIRKVPAIGDPVELVPPTELAAASPGRTFTFTNDRSAAATGTDEFKEFAEGDKIEVFTKFESSLSGGTADTPIPADVYQETLFSLDWIAGEARTIDASNQNRVSTATVGIASLDTPESQTPKDPMFTWGTTFTTDTADEVEPSGISVANKALLVTNLVAGRAATLDIGGFGGVQVTSPQSQALTILIANQAEYFQLWYNRQIGGVIGHRGRTLVEFGGNFVSAWDESSIVFRSRDTETITAPLSVTPFTPTDVTIQSQQHVRNWDNYLVEHGRSGNIEVLSQDDELASLDTVVLAAEFGIDNSTRVQAIQMDVASAEAMVQSMRSNRLLGIKPQSAATSNDFTPAEAGGS